MPEDTPIAFYDLSWIAVRGGTREALLSVLDLSAPAPATWKQGINAVAGDFYDFAAESEAWRSRIFITPEVEGWRFAVGGSLGGDDSEGKDIAELCQTLSRDFGEAHAFTTQGRMEWYSWCLASGGSVYRQFIWADSVLVDIGTATPRESQFWSESGPKRPNESFVMAIAAEVSVAPCNLASMISTGNGVLAVTKWGRQHGVPRRALDDD